MTASDRYGLLPLDTWRAILHFHPFHFWQLANTTTPLTGAADGLVRQYAWQSADAVGRSEILEAIVTAEDRLREYLGYSVAPRAVAETCAWPRLSDRFLVRTNSSGPDGRYVSVTLAEGQIQAVGADTFTLLGTAAVTYSDIDGDGVNDTFTCSVATSATDVTQIEAYFAAADQFDSYQPMEHWKIAPVRVAITGGVATITGRAWLLVKPVKYEGVQILSSSAIDTSGAISPSMVSDPTTANNFVATLAIYLHTTNPNGTTITTSQATLVWETRPCIGSWCLCDAQSTAVYTPSAFDPAAQAFAVARVGVRDAELGIVTPAEALMDATTGIWTEVRFDPWYEPDRVTVRYRAGLPLDSVTGQMQRAFQPIVARLAAAELTRPIAATDAANRELYRWQFDLARGGGKAEEQFQISPSDLSNPLGTRAGQVWAWKQIQNMQQLRGIAPG